MPKCSAQALINFTPILNFGVPVFILWSFAIRSFWDFRLVDFLGAAPPRLLGLVGENSNSHRPLQLKEVRVTGFSPAGPQQQRSGTCLEYIDDFLFVVFVGSIALLGILFGSRAFSLTCQCLATYGRAHFKMFRRFPTPPPFCFTLSGYEIALLSPTGPEWLFFCLSIRLRQLHQPVPLS